MCMYVIMISKVTNRERFVFYSLLVPFIQIRKKCNRPNEFFRQLNYLFIVILTKLNFLKLLKLYWDTFKFAEKNICAYQISPMHKVLCQQYLTICNYYNQIYFEKISKKEIKKWLVGESLENNFIFFHLCLHHSPEQCHPTSHFSQGTIHILRKHIFRLLGPRTPYVSIFSVLKVSGNYHILALPHLQVLT